MLKLNEVYLGDCLEVMKDIDSESIQLICTDLPYGQLKSSSEDGGENCGWDVLIPFDKLWEQWIRILKPNGTAITTASGLFTGQVIMSQPKLYKYDLVWNKTRVTGFLNGRDKHLRSHENILVFSKGSTGHEGSAVNRWIYNPVGIVPLKETKLHTNKANTSYIKIRGDKIGTQEFTNWPQSILKFQSEMDIIHPTQKSVPLYKNLIEVFSNEGDVILDPTSGSGTSLIAARQCGRNFIGIEKEKEYYDLIVKRLNQTETKSENSWIE